jgi:phosphatidylserine synthase
MTAKIFAWLVHLYTAMGLVCAAGIAVLIVRGGDDSFRRAFMLMLVATAIDATDWLAGAEGAGSRRCFLASADGRSTI